MKKSLIAVQALLESSSSGHFSGCAILALHHLQSVHLFIKVVASEHQIILFCVV